jgi:hypothetical protein
MKHETLGCVLRCNVSTMGPSPANLLQAPKL